MPDRYQAVVFSEHGDASVLHIEQLEVPRPASGQVRIHVQAAGVNPIDWKIRSGAASAWMSVKLPHVPGVDVAGVIEAVGPGVEELQVGDEVFGQATSGSYAEKALANVARLAAKPAGLAWEAAAALPTAALTSWHALDVLQLQAGETIVVDGAAGGVGTLAVQFARRRGASVIGTASEHNHDYLRSIGAIPVQYGDGLADRIRAAAPGGIDAALDAAGHGSLPALVDLAGNGERVVTVADFSAPECGARFLSGQPEDLSRALSTVAGLVADKAITIPAVTYPLSQAAEAHRRSEAGHARGKLVLVPDSRRCRGSRGAGKGTVHHHRGRHDAGAITPDPDETHRVRRDRARQGRHPPPCTRRGGPGVPACPQGTP